MDTKKVQEIYDNLTHIAKESTDFKDISLGNIDECCVVDGVQFYIPANGLKVQDIYDFKMLLKRKSKFIECDVGPSPEINFDCEDDAMDAFCSGDLQFGIYFVIPRVKSVQKYKDYVIANK